MRLFMALLILCIGPVTLLGQVASTIKQLPPGFVDGSKNPELIPDHASYRLILAHLSSLNSADPKAAARHEMIARQMGLSATDATTLATHSRQFGLDYAQWKLRAGPSPTPAAEEEAKTMALLVRDHLIKGLTTEGAS